MTKFLNKKGQAALTDTIFMLTIIGVLTTLLFSFSSDYGMFFSEQIGKQYTLEFTTDALKTILYSSVSRIPGQEINPKLPNATNEVDYLLAKAKEDYAEDKKFEKESLDSFRDAIERVMLPVSSQQDYAFFISANKDTEYVVFILYKTEFKCNNGPCTGDIESASLTVGSPAHRFYYCGSQDPGKRLTSEKIGAFFFRLGDVFTTSAPIQLVESEIKGPENKQYIDSSAVTAKAYLATWDSTLISDDYLADSEQGIACIPA